MGSINYGLSSIAPTANNIGCLSCQNTTIYFYMFGFCWCYGRLYGTKPGESDRWPIRWVNRFKKNYRGYLQKIVP